MIRYFLAQGDRAGSAAITEGLGNVTCSNPPPRVNIATLYMKTYCTACNKEGYVAPKGPRLPGTGPNGQPWALSGDINVCGCNPPPVFYAVRGMSMVLTSEQVAQSTGHGKSSSSSPTRVDSPHWIEFKLADPGNWAGLGCIAHFDDGTSAIGVVDYKNVVRFEQPTGKVCQRLTLTAEENSSSSTFVDAYLATVTV
jgi:hypothetical protein